MRPELSPRIVPAGEAAVLIELGEVLDSGINQQVYALDEWLGVEPLDGILTRVPGFCSILIAYDPLKLTYSDVTTWLAGRLDSCPVANHRQPKQVVIPVHYGGENGPDLSNVARIHRMTPEEVVRRHTDLTYTVGMMGFTPGFAYLMGLDPELTTPRLTNPRTQVPAGAVGIAGEQTGIYPLESPGGWQLIGRTDLVLYDPQQESPFLLAPGDRVRFVAAEGSIVR
ncbi:MAG: 5-oxoprolinase subunit PxpB [Anaerolineaceae bacterium]|nr:5-oxoprolinase subunit PxpB [Anaerolineaceae bacterium]